MASKSRIDRRWLILFLVAAGLVAASRRHSSSQSAGLKALAERKPMADIALPQLGGGVWKLSDHRGRVVLINYWATWCEPCRDELPALLQVVGEARPDGPAVVGISMDTAASVQARAQKVQRYVTLYRVPYPIAFADAMLDARSIDIALPTTILIDTEGRVAKSYIGEVERAVLAQDVTALMAENLPSRSTDGSDSRVGK